MIKAMNHVIHPLMWIFMVKVAYGKNDIFLHSGIDLEVLTRVDRRKKDPYVDILWRWE